MVNVSLAILESIGEGLIAVDKEKKIVLANKAAETMLGWKKEKLLGREFISLSMEDEKGDSLSPEQRPMQIALSGNKIIGNHYFYIRKDKSKIAVALTATPVVVEGEIVGAVTLFRDITEEKELDKAKSEFIYIASHGLMTPLSVAKLYLEGIQRNAYFKKAPKNIREYVTEIYRSNGRSITLVRNLLSVSRIDQGSVSDAPEMVNVLDLLKKIVKEMTGIAQKNNVSLSIKKKQKSIPDISIDPQRLREVIENLVSNAIKYNLPKGKVEVALEKKDDWLFFSVHDTGIGISEKDQKRLFVKFFRSEKVIANNAEGTGLGLYVAKSYIEGWGGKIFVESEEGKGSTFSFVIPFKTK